VGAPKPDVISEVLPNGCATVMGTANPVSSDLNQFVKTHTLDSVRRLNPKGFPHAPKEGSDQIKPTVLNLQYLLEAYGVMVVYDEIKKKLFIFIPGQVGSADNQDNVALAHIYSLATLNGMATSSIGNLLIVIGDRNRRNPVKDWIQSKPWDGVDRFEEFANTIQERKGYPVAMKTLLLRKWLRSAIAAVLMAQGFHCRGVLVLQGKQSVGKSSWFQALIPNAVLGELVILLGHNLDPANKDSVTKAISHWIVELGELDSTFKKDIARVKGFLTSGSDKIRRPYGRLESEYPRRTVFCASVNDTCFLVDETGNSRFWTIAVESVNYQHDIDMQQLFAQIAVEFHAREQWWLTQGEEMQLALVNADHRVVSMVRERLMAAIDTEPPAAAKTKAMSAIDMLQEAGIDKPTNPQCKECASILRELYGDSKKVRGIYVWRVVLADRGQFGSSGAASTTDVDDDLY
jgi:putative DNA primase/helicase